MNKAPTYKTSIWLEEADRDNPFNAASSYCYGYDVYRDILPQANWFEYIYLLFTGKRLNNKNAGLFNSLAIAMANPGPRDASVRAAMNGGVSGAPAAASLMSALAIGSGNLGGAHEIYLLVWLLNLHGNKTDNWQQEITNLNKQPEDIWHRMEHLPGLDPNQPATASQNRDILNALQASGDHPTLLWLNTELPAIESRYNCGVNTTMIFAAALHDLGFSPEAAEMVFLILRLPGAAAHAIEQTSLGWKQYPFYAPLIKLSKDPGNMGLPEIKGLEL